MVQLYRSNLGDRRGEFLEPTEESRFFTLNLDEALREFDSRRISRELRKIPLHGHDYSVNDPPTLASYLVYADDLYFICEKDESSETIVGIVKNVLSK